MIAISKKDNYKKIQRENRKQRKALYCFWLFEKILLAIAILTIIIFPIYCVKTGNFVSTVTRTEEKSYFLVCMLTSIIAGMELVLVLLISVIRKRAENIIIGDRVDEEITVTDRYLFYTFRIKYQSLADERNLVIIDLQSINKIVYNEKTYQINIEGQMTEKIINLSAVDEYDVDDCEFTDSTLKIFDYFEPNLYNILKNYVTILMRQV